MIKRNKFIYFGVLYTVLNIILKILNYIFGIPLFYKKDQKNKKSPSQGDFG